MASKQLQPAQPACNLSRPSGSRTPELATAPGAVTASFNKHNEPTHVDLESTHYKPYRPKSSGLATASDAATSSSTQLGPSQIGFIPQSFSVPAKYGFVIESSTATFPSKQIEPSKIEPIAPISLEPTSSVIATGTDAATEYSHQPAIIRVEPTQSQQGIHESTTSEPATELRVTTEYRILVFGATGSGKSSFIRATTGREVEIGHDIVSCM